VRERFACRLPARVVADLIDVPAEARAQTAMVIDMPVAGTIATGAGSQRPGHESGTGKACRASQRPGAGAVVVADACAGDACARERDARGGQLAAAGAERGGTGSAR